MRRGRVRVAIALVVIVGMGWTSGLIQGPTDAAVAHVARPVPSVLQPVLSQIKRAGIPVYVPTWLPDRTKVDGAMTWSAWGTQASVTSRGYDVIVYIKDPGEPSICVQCVMLAFGGRKGALPLNFGARPVRIGKHHWAYLQPKLAVDSYPPITWLEGTVDTTVYGPTMPMVGNEYWYFIGGQAGFSDQDLIHMASSIVRVK